MLVGSLAGIAVSPGFTARARYRDAVRLPPRFSHT